jgi:hypothetical protein
MNDLISTLAIAIVLLQQQLRGLNERASELARPRLSDLARAARRRRDAVVLER